jgi:hypothetical protein
MRLLASALILLGIILRPNAPAHALSPGDAACRKTLADAVLELDATVLKEQQRGHKVRMSATDPVNFPLTVDSNDIAARTAKAQAKITKASSTGSVPPAISPRSGAAAATIRPKRRGAAGASGASGLLCTKYESSTCTPP